MKVYTKAVAIILTVTLLLAVSLPAAASAETYYVIKGTAHGRTCSAFSSLVDVEEGESVSVLNATGDEMMPDEIVGTGCILRILDENGNLIREQSIVIMGDVTGSGVPGLSQLIRLSGALRGTDLLEGACFAAGDLNGSGRIDTSDLVLMARSLRENEDNDSATKEPVLSRKTIQLTYYTGDVEPLELCYVNGVRDLPYISVEDAEKVLETVYRLQKIPGYTLLRFEEMGRIGLERENGSRLVLDFQSDTMRFTDYNLFSKSPYLSTALDLLADPGTDSQGRPAYFKRDEGSAEKTGGVKEVRLGDYGIDLIRSDNEGYMPFQTFSDVLLSPAKVYAVCNGEMAIITYGSIRPFRDAYYAVGPAPRSKELAEFTYNELCLTLDMFYGLRTSVGIHSFDGVLRMLGLTNDLLSTDASVSDRMLSELLDQCIAAESVDGHTQTIMRSYLNSEVQRPGMTGRTASETEPESDAARVTGDVSVYRTYQEVGDTAYVTIDNFGVRGADYYTQPPDKYNPDTFAVIIYAHSQITRENSPIRNVVLDLSNNGGGAVDTGIYVAAWLLGGCTVAAGDTCTGATASTKYLVDVNLDRSFDASDSVGDRNLFCVTSEKTYSCGNMVASILKESGRVTLIGEKSSGGSCCVRAFGTADGAAFQMSGPYQFCTVREGVYRGIEGGTIPHHEMENPQQYRLARLGMTTYIQSLIE